MKWRSSSSFAFIIFLCGVFTVANSSPAAKKEAFEPKKEKLDEKITPSISEDQVADEDDDDLLARSKKSSVVTTFCVKIEPGNDQPAVVVCQPENANGIPEPSLPQPPAQQPEGPSYQTPEMVPEYTRGLEPQPSPPYEPLIFIPQQPQILQPQILQPQIYAPYVQPPQILQPYPQPQIVLIRDPNCPSNPANTPTAYVSPSSKNLYPHNLYSQQLFGKSSQDERAPANIWQGGYEPEMKELRSIPVGSNFGGMFSNQGYSSLSDLINSKHGQAQQNPLTNIVTPAQGPRVINRIPNLRDQYDTFAIQCKPSVVQLPQDAYGAASLASVKSDDQAAFNPVMKSIGATGFPASQFMQQYSSGQGSHGGYTTHGAMHHQKELSTHNGQQYHTNAYPHNNPYSHTHYRTMPGFGAQERAAGEGQAAVKTGQEMFTQQDHGAQNSFTKNIGGQQFGEQIQSHSQPTFKAQGGHQGVPGGDGKALINQEHQQKIGSGDKLMEGSQNSESRFYPNSFGQGQNNFANGAAIQTSNSKDQGLQKQLEFSSQNQQQQQQQQQTIPSTPRNSDTDESRSQQTTGKNTSYSQMLMQRMKSAAAQGNMVHPFMTLDEKQTYSKA